MRYLIANLANPAFKLSLVEIRIIRTTQMRKTLSYETVHSGKMPHSAAVHLSMYDFTVCKSVNLEFLDSSLQTNEF